MVLALVGLSTMTRVEPPAASAQLLADVAAWLAAMRMPPNRPTPMIRRVGARHAIIDITRGPVRPKLNPRTLFTNIMTKNNTRTQ